MARQLTNPTHRADVVVVGARCAGAATALLLASAGHDVVLVDRSDFPSDTLSTNAIARSGMVQLNRWGLLPAVLDAGTPPIRDVEFHSGQLSVSRTIKDRLGVGMLVAPRRHILDALLVEAAVAAGARLVTGVTVDGVRRRFDGRIIGITGRRDDHVVEVAARFVVGGHGISVAFRDAELLATTLDDVIRGKDDERNALADYHAMRDSQLPTPSGPCGSGGGPHQ